MKNLKDISHALCLLFNPLVEVVIHDLNTGLIAHIEGDLSLRQVGDLSLIEENSTSLEGHVKNKVYCKTSHDGRTIRSISIPIKENGNLSHLMCINFDASLFSHVQDLTRIFLEVETSSKPQLIFKNDWQDKAHEIIKDNLKKIGKTLYEVNNREKKAILKELFNVGGFNPTGAADYYAKILNISRATVFNTLKLWKNEL